MESIPDSQVPLQKSCNEPRFNLSSEVGLRLDIGEGRLRRILRHMRWLREALFLLFIPCCLCGQPPQSFHTLIFVSDTQAPTWVEKLYLRSNNNVLATERIFGAILGQENLSAVIHGGDITAYGSSGTNWSTVLPFLDSLRARSVPFIAARGNHDYYLSASEGMENFRRFVPSCPQDYSLHAYGPVAVILLNSNFGHLTDSTIAEQRRWYVETLSRIDTERSIHFAITVTHHPPYTNSTLVSGSREVQDNFLDAFDHSTKSVVFISGHAHRFEHFRVNGKDFLVIGGGGGLFHDKESTPTENDLYTGKDRGMFFHFVRCGVWNDSLSFEVIKILPVSGKTEVVHQFTILSPSVGRN